MPVTAQQLVTDAASRIRRLSPAEVEAYVLVARSAVLLDVRETEELDEHGWIAPALHVPRGLLESRADPACPLHHPGLDRGQLTIVCSGTGRRSALAAATLQALGYREVTHLQGGVTEWKRVGLPVVGLDDWHPPAASVHTDDRRHPRDRSPR